jgi:hypothetical protein
MKLTTFVFQLQKNEVPFRGEGGVSSDTEDGQGGEDDNAGRIPTFAEVGDGGVEIRVDSGGVQTWD